jgi:high-affinity nickel permease
MFGLDDSIASLSSGGSVLLVCVVAVLLGLRHAGDPDHLAAVTTLIASGQERAARGAARLGIAWGLGHATSLFVFGLPIVLFERYLPERLQRGAETLVAAMIVYLAVRLLYRWRAGYFHLRAHGDHVHPRTRLGAYGIGLAHGLGGSAGVGVLIIATVDSRALAVVSLVLLAFFTAASMTILTTGFGRTLDTRLFRNAFARVAPAFGALSLAFGVWYGAAAWAVAPYPF